MQDENSSEWLTFSLAHPLCLVTGVQIRPYRAVWQPGHPIYSPKKVKISLGGTTCFSSSTKDRLYGPIIDWMDSMQDPEVRQALKTSFGIDIPETKVLESVAARSSKSKGGRPFHDWYHESEEFSVAKEDRLQTFKIPPTLCVGGFLRLDLLGRTQRQPGDELFYSELNHFLMAFSMSHETVCFEMNKILKMLHLRSMQFSQTTNLILCSLYWVCSLHRKAYI